MAAIKNIDIKKNILDETTSLLQQMPFKDITLSKIAKNCNISKGTLYYYYQSKDDILFDIIDNYLNGLAKDLLSWVNNINKDTSYHRLINYILKYGTDPRMGNLRLYLIGEAVSCNQEIKNRYIVRYQYFKETLTAKIKERCNNLDSDYVAWLLLTVMDGIIIQNQLQNQTFDRELFIKKTVKMLTQLEEK